MGKEIEVQSESQYNQIKQRKGNLERINAQEELLQTVEELQKTVKNLKKDLEIIKKENNNASER